MKRLLFICLVVVLASCGGDDPKPVSIVGKWEITNTALGIQVEGVPLKQYLISQGYSEADAQAVVDELNDEFDVSQLTGTFEFKSDGTWTGVTTDTDGSSEGASGTYTISDDKKKVTMTGGDDGPVNADIVSLTETELKLDIIAESDDDTIPVDFVLSLTFKRK